MMLTSSKPFTLLFFLFLFIISCSETPTEIQSTSTETVSVPIDYNCNVEANWMFTSIQNTDGEDVKPITSEDFMTLTSFDSENFFYYHLKAAKIFSSGLWEEENGTLKLYYDPKPDSIFYDSIAHVSIQEKTSCTFYFHGDLVHEIDISEVTRKTRVYEITICSGDSLIFEENGINYAFIK